MWTLGQPADVEFVTRKRKPRINQLMEVHWRRKTGLRFLKVLFFASACFWRARRYDGIFAAEQSDESDRLWNCQYIVSKITFLKTYTIFLGEVHSLRRLALRDPHQETVLYKLGYEAVQECRQQGFNEIGYSHGAWKPLDVFPFMCQLWLFLILWLRKRSLSLAWAKSRTLSAKSLHNWHSFNSVDNQEIFALFFTCTKWFFLFSWK